MRKRVRKMSARTSDADQRIEEAHASGESPAEALINSRKPLRDPVSDRPSSPPDIETDKVLESLHLSLRQQLTIQPHLSAETRASSLSGSLSGAMTKTAGRTHEVPPPGKRASVPKGGRRRPVPPRVGESLTRVRELLAASKAIGVEQTKAREDLKWGELALEAKEFKVASTCFRKADKQARERLKDSLPEILKRTKDSLKSLEKHQGSSQEGKDLLEVAGKAIESEQYADAIQSLNEASKKIRDGEQEVVLKIMFNAKERFMLARKAGVNIDRPLNLLRVSREKLKLGKFEEAVMCAEEGQKLVEDLLKREHKGKRHLSECMKAIRIAELLGAGSKDLDVKLNETMRLFKTDDLDRALESSRSLTAMARKAAYDKAASTYEMSERALGVAKNLGLDVPTAEEALKHAREKLEKDDPVGSFTLSNSIIVDTSTIILESLNEKMKSIGQFAKGIEGEVMSLTEVQDAIEHTKERSLENFRRYAKLSEDLVHQAFESAISYTRVSQDVVKGVFNNSLAVNGGKAVSDGELAGKGEVSAEIVASAGTSPEDKRLRIINLYLDGKITESQLERLLTLIDSSVAKVNLV